MSQSCESAFKPRDQKAVRTAAETFRPNPGLDTASAITELGVGEALISLLDEKGSPTPVERALVRPPLSRLDPLTDEERSAIIRRSVLCGHYEKAVDRESAYEKLKEKAAAAAEQPGPAAKVPAGGKESDAGRIIGAMTKSAAHAIGSRIGHQIVRGVLGSLVGGSRGRSRR